MAGKTADAQPQEQPIEEALRDALNRLELTEQRARMLESFSARFDVRTLDERMAAVQKELEDVPRRGHAEIRKDGALQYTYDYLLEADLMKGVRPLLSKHGIATYYSDEILRIEGGLATVRVTMTFAAGGEQRVCMTEGVALDRGDRHVNKAKTHAVRYLLWKTFLQPSDDDPEGSVEDAAAVEQVTAQRARRAAGTQVTRGKVIERIGKLTTEIDEVQGRAPGATLTALPGVVSTALGKDVDYPTGVPDEGLVAIAGQLAQFAASERARKDADPDSYAAAALELQAR